jgi:hypothetical protein
MSDRGDNLSLPLPFVESMIDGARKLLLSAASTALKPQQFHPRLNRAEAQQLLDASRFGHTERGSFVFKISCPIDAVDVSPPFLAAWEAESFTRHTMLIVHNAVTRLVEAIETDTLPGFVDNVRTDPRPIVSSNLCEALTLFHDEILRNSVELSISWAANQRNQEPLFLAAHVPIRIQEDYFPRIEEIHRALQPSTEPHQDTFIATVEQLSGTMGIDGQRAGEVVLSLLLSDGEKVRVRTTLTPDQYREADKAHMTDGAYVRVTGILRRGRQPRPLANVTRFELLLPPKPETVFDAHPTLGGS